MENLNKRRLGADREMSAATYLRRQGLVILEQNFRCRQGEIDIVCRDGSYLVFVEVKYRRNEEKGSPQEAVGIVKQKKICRVADYYRLAHSVGNDMDVRYDVVAIQGERITWIKNAFPHHY